jgi:hypothetical protein
MNTLVPLLVVCCILHNCVQEQSVSRLYTVFAPHILAPPDLSREVFLADVDDLRVSESRNIDANVLKDYIVKKAQFETPKWWLFRSRMSLERNREWGLIRDRRIALSCGDELDVAVHQGTNRITLTDGGVSVTFIDESLQPNHIKNLPEDGTGMAWVHSSYAMRACRLGDRVLVMKWPQIAMGVQCHQCKIEMRRMDGRIEWNKHVTPAAPGLSLESCEVDANERSVAVYSQYNTGACAVQVVSRENGRTTFWWSTELYSTDQDSD